MRGKSYLGNQGSKIHFMPQAVPSKMREWRREREKICVLHCTCIENDSSEIKFQKNLLKLRHSCLHTIRFYFVINLVFTFAWVRAYEHEYPIYVPNGYMPNVMMNFQEFERWINMKICMRKVEKIYVLLTYVRVLCAVCVCVYIFLSLYVLYHSNSACPQWVCAAWK